MDLQLLGKEPISQDNPSGSDIRYDPEFEELKAEVDKLSTPKAAGSIDWGKVVKLSSGILNEKSKDLLVASYLSVGLIHTRKFEGFIIGLTIYRDLIEEFWDTLFPQKTRMRGRTSAIEWWMEKTEEALMQLKNIPVTEELLSTAKELIGKMDELLSKQVEDCPSIHPLLDLLNALSAKTAVNGKREEIQAAAARKEETEEKIDSTEDAEKSLEKRLEKLSEISSFLWKQDISNPLIYRLNRTALWMTIKGHPLSSEGKTRIPPPPVQVINLLSDLTGKGEDEALLRAAEERLSQFIFWLDLNYYAAESLAHMGDQYEKAREAVCQETAMLLQRFPELINLAFSDGTPFASSKTRQWIKTIISNQGSEPATDISFSQTQAGDDDEMQQEAEEAQALIKSKKLVEALQRFQTKINTSASKKNKLLWRATLSQLLINNKKEKFAMPLLEEIIKDIDIYHLEEYDSELSLKCLKLVWNGYESQNDDLYKHKASEILMRIGKLDLSEMILLDKK